MLRPAFEFMINAVSLYHVIKLSVLSDRTKVINVT